MTTRSILINISVAKIKRVIIKERKIRCVLNSLTFRNYANFSFIGVTVNVYKSCGN